MSIKSMASGGFLLAAVLCLVFVVTAHAQSCIPAPSGLVGWWPGEGTANDIQNGNDGLLQNGVTFGQAKVGSGFTFDGSDDRVIVPDAAILDFGIGSDFSIEAWVLPNACLLPPPPVALVSWWTGDQSPNDIVGFTVASLTGGAGFGPGLVDQAFHMDGVDDVITVSSVPQLNFPAGQDFSIGVWINASPNAKAGETIIDKRVAPGTLDRAVGYALFLVDGKLGFQMADAPLVAGAVSTFISTGADLRDGIFHHVAVAVDRDQPMGGKLYVDGQVIMTFDPRSEPGDLSTAEPFRIGNHATTGFDAFFAGAIDEVQVYRRALGALEIAQISQAGSQGSCKKIGESIVLDSAKFSGFMRPSGPPATRWF